MVLIKRGLCQFLLVISFLLFAQGVEAQVQLSAKYKNQLLKLKFTNSSNEEVKVPDLSVRFGEDKTFLFKEYYSIERDTIYLYLNEEISKKLYSIRSAEPYIGETSAKLQYNDRVLLPEKKYRTKIKVSESCTIRFLVLRYKDIELKCKLD